jgi:ABC-2 type transport system ATP-binding protein
MQLLDVSREPARTYSGGMVRRLELAQALVNRPSLLILDEPTVGLDPIARDGVWTQVQNMQAEFGMTVLLTTHYMEEADVLCDRVALDLAPGGDSQKSFREVRSSRRTARRVS